MPTIKPPKQLGTAGASIWTTIHADMAEMNYSLRPDEVLRLLSVCKTADTLQMLEDAWRDLGHPMVSVGSMKQEVIHPLIGEIRTQRAALNKALIDLKLPDSAADEGAGDASSAARRAASARWNKGA